MILSVSNTRPRIDDLTQAAGLNMSRDSDSSRVHPRLSFTKPFKGRSSPSQLEEFAERFDSLAPYFPEVDGEIRVGITTSFYGLAMIGTKRGVAFHKICFPPLEKKGMPSRYVLAHELMHIVTSKADSLPGTERSCDIFTLARLPPAFIDRPPIYLKVPKRVKEVWSEKRYNHALTEAAHLLAIEAIVTRKKNPRYISWWERNFSDKARMIIGDR